MYMIGRPLGSHMSLQSEYLPNLDDWQLSLYLYVPYRCLFGQLKHRRVLVERDLLSNIGEVYEAPQILVSRFHHHQSQKRSAHRNQ